MKFINIGFGNIVSAHRLIAIVSPESAPIKRIIQNAIAKIVLNIVLSFIHFSYFNINIK